MYGRSNKLRQMKDNKNLQAGLSVKQIGLSVKQTGLSIL
jgi:hypothetical protein